MGYGKDKGQTIIEKHWLAQYERQEQLKTA